MSFDFFNNSHLAFGKKIATAFNTLDSMLASAQKNLEQAMEDLKYYEEYANRNYLVPRPTKPTSPCRTNEIFDVVNDKNVYIRKIKYTNGVLQVDIGLFNRSNNRITRLKGETNIKSGFCYYSAEAISNKNVNREVLFSDDRAGATGNILFEYRVDEAGIVVISGSISNLDLIPESINYATGMSLGDKVSSGGAYTAKGYECLCIIGQTNNIEVKLDDTTILKGKGVECMRHCILYAKKGAKISGTYSEIYRIHYNR